MAITWYWGHILGEMVRKQEHPTAGKRTFTSRLLGGGNCLAVLAERANADDDGKPYDKPVWTVYGEFWDDTRHLTNCLGITKVAHTKKLHNLYDNVTKLRLNTYYMDEIKPIMNAFIKTHTRIELYYKKPKGAKK